MSKVVALDSSIIIILADGSSSVPNGKQRMLEALEEHKDAGDAVCLPAVALAECAHAEASLWNRMRILNFNVPAAMLANRITATVVNEGRAHTAANAPPKKQELKVDAMILATAEAANADVFYTTDDWFERAAKRCMLKIEVRGVPPLKPYQINLPSPDDPETTSEQTSVAVTERAAAPDPPTDHQGGQDGPPSAPADPSRNHNGS